MKDKNDQVFQYEFVDPGKLKRHPRNYRDHPDDQIAHIIQSIRDNGIYKNVVVTQNGTILGGHGVVKAALKMGLKKIPVRRLKIDPNSKRALRILTGDNEMANLSVNDEAMLAALLKEIAPDGLMGTGFNQEQLDDLIKSLKITDGLTDSPYTKLIKAPIYSPRDEKPEVSQLFDMTKAVQLIEEIEAAKIPQDIKTFLRFAAYRHNVFDYEKVADYYAHAPKSVQDLMERSALVIIDFKKAIENGFVDLTDGIAAEFPEEDED